MIFNSNHISQNSLELNNKIETRTFNNNNNV